MMGVLLAAALGHRHVLTELRITANQVHAGVAFEAAEAGLSWAQARLNSPLAIGDDCEPSGAAGADGFRERYLQTRADGRIDPRLRGAPGSPQPRQALCLREGDGWRCHCPTESAPSLAAPADPRPRPAFLVEWQAVERPGVVQVSATGCSHLASPCLPGAAERADASARLRVGLALLPALATPPAAVLTVQGQIDAGTAALGLHNADALSGGLAAHAGGRLLGTRLRLSTAPGAPVAAATLASDESLATTSAAAFFARHFGTDPDAWRRQPGVRTVDCRGGDCGDALRSALEGATDTVRIAVAGDLALSGRQRVGSATAPVVLVVEGTLRLQGPVQLHGLVHARGLRWDAADEGDGALLRGAVLLSGDYGGDASADLVYDVGLMRRLAGRSGSWVRVPGSWRDG
jgi:hypothetical protein